MGRIKTIVFLLFISHLMGPFVWRGKCLSTVLTRTHTHTHSLTLTLTHTNSTLSLFLSFFLFLRLSGDPFRLLTAWGFGLTFRGFATGEGVGLGPLFQDKKKVFHVVGVCKCVCVEGVVSFLVNVIFWRRRPRGQRYQWEQY